MANITSTENWREFRWNPIPDTEVFTSKDAIAAELVVRFRFLANRPQPPRHEADRDIAEGRVSEFKTMTGLLKSLRAKRNRG